MVEACSSCRISIVTKGHKVAGGNTRYVTSIWALSGDRTVRLQQKRAFPAIPAEHSLTLLQWPMAWRSYRTRSGAMKKR